MNTPQSFWIFQYTNDGPTGGLLEDSQGSDSDGVINWLWKNNRKREPASGDLVFFLRSGAKPKGYPSDTAWRGIVGFGVVVGDPFSYKSANSGEFVPVETLAFFPDRVLPDYLIWHDHRVASATSLYGQQGTNFLIDTDVAIAIIDELDAPEDGLIRADVRQFSLLNSLLEYRYKLDAVTRNIDVARAWLDRDAAIAAQLARAISGKSSGRPGELTWTHLFFGVLLCAKGFQKHTRKNVAALFLYQLSDPTENDQGSKSFRPGNAKLDAYWGSIGGAPITQLKRSDAVQIESMSSSAERVIDEAKALSEDQLVSIEALLAGLLNTHPKDSVYRDIFDTDRDGIIEAIATQARENSRVSEVEQFLEWVARVDLIKGETDDTPNPELDPEPDPEPDPDPDPDPNFPIGQIATTLNDNAKGREDLLSVKEEAKAFARLIASTSFEPPLAIGVFGPWGSGKSFFMNQIEMEIDKLADPKFTGENGQPLQSKSDFHGKIVQIQFNAWHYMESNIWASLVDVIFKALDAWLRKENGGAQEGERVDALFDSLATAQEERLDAIEALAQKVSTLETARQNLSDIEEKTQNYWKAVLRKLTETALTNDDLQKAFDALGLHQLNSDVENLQAAITEARTAVSDADLLSRSLRSRVSSTGNLVGLAAVILLGPLLISGIISFAKTKGLLGPGSTLNINEVVTTLSALVASATGWVGFVTARAKSGVAALRKLQSNFDTIDAEREGAQKTYLEKLETDIEEAQSRISKTEEAVAKAQSRLMEKTSASRIAAFIRERAEGDVYSKHLGIIDTIRCDFEQLSDLIEHSKTGEEEEKKTLKRYQEHLAIQIDAIKTRYKLNKESKSPDASTDEPDAQADADEDLNYTDELRADPYARVRIAIETLEASSKEGVQLATAFDRIVLYIDDLDRCPPDKVYEVLQAVHLFLNFPLFMVVVGVDTRWIETSLKRELGDLVGEGSSVSPTDYLEKIFQIPYWIRQMEASSAQNFVKGILFEKDSRASEAQSDRDDFDDQSEDDEVGTEQFSPEAPPDSSSRPQAENVSTELPPESVQRHDQASDDQLPDGQDGTDSTEEDNDDAGGSRIFARPVEITADERAILEEFAPFAGQSPRKLLRFVNVYGLIKSVDQEDGSSLIDCTNDPVGCRALVAQLALATGEPTAAMTHFERITSSDACSDYFKPRQSVGPETELVPDFPPDISALIWKPLSLVLLSKERDEAALTELFDKLKLTAAVARRYTFASSDAVRSEAL